jgi:hypothetical protein
LDLFWSGYRSALVKYLDVSILKTRILTIHKVAHLYHSRANAHEEHTVFLILRVEFGHNDVHGRLGGRVQSTCLNLEIVDQVEVGVTAGNGDDLLELALHDKREEEVEEVDVADDIGLE